MSTAGIEPRHLRRKWRGKAWHTAWLHVRTLKHTADWGAAPLPVHARDTSLLGPEDRYIQSGGPGRS